MLLRLAKTDIDIITLQKVSEEKNEQNILHTDDTSVNYIFKKKNLNVISVLLETTLTCVNF